MLSNVIVLLIVLAATVYSVKKMLEFFSQAAKNENMRCSCSGCPGGCKTTKK